MDGPNKWGILKVMLKRNLNPLNTDQMMHASIFAALGDKTRLSLIAELCKEQPRSISQLAENSKLTRQAITKHLQVLQGAGIVRKMRRGRESLFEIELEPIEKVKTYLDHVSEQWDHALSRLKSFVEE